ncbi:DUF3043 domain-containing protein [Nocardioides marmoribigeumensis]|uniref:DUF3043 domain-containing protein n=1 Tax=Nocardioides marmoribigeumensis TaxID=433649 RepID=A0ABU2BPN2_9ACTN|nr:DUF3043 domain-containing protein [Nocardioides marmoribigeumensis]MDR7360595.1 hypothetical protein [Nocardioides marmoribigeumensis]
MFRRTKSAVEAQPEPAAPKAGGKGRPTPTRKEAEAAARARAKAARNPKAAKGQSRAMRSERSQEIRAGMRAGEEKYLLPRDQGPVRRFVRDYVDSRLNMAEFAMPLLIVSLLAQVGGALNLGAGIMNATLVVVVLDAAWLRFRLRRQLRERFGKEHLKGTTFYALMRALQMRFMRIPKPQVRIGQELTGRYPKP